MSVESRRACQMLEKKHKSTLRSVAWMFTVRSVAWLLYVVSLRQRDFSGLCSEKVSRYFDGTESLCRLKVGVLVRCWKKTQVHFT